MTQGVARAGSVLKSTGARGTATVNAAQKSGMDQALYKKRQTQTAGPADFSRKDTNAPVNSAALRSGNLMMSGQGPNRSAQKSTNGNGDEQGALLQQQSLNIDAEQRENYREHTRLGHEIREREQMMKRARAEFTYKKPLSGPGFYGILLLVIAKDVLDIILEIVGIFADLTVILGIVVWCISTMFDFLVLMSTQLYLFVSGVPMNKQKVMVQSVSTIIELLPIAGFLPAGTIAFVLVRIMANKEAKEKAIAELEEQEAAWQSEQEAALAQQSMLQGENASLANTQRATQNVIAFNQRNSAVTTPQALEQAA